MYEYRKTDELCHYGVLGMKWGVRKDPYRNEYDRAFDRSAKVYNQVAKKAGKYANKYDRAKSVRRKERLGKKMDLNVAIASQIMGIMEDTFAGMSPEVFSKETLERGKHLTYMLNPEAKAPGDWTMDEYNQEVEKAQKFRENLQKNPGRLVRWD